jgi:hypothetical protein
MFILSHRGLWKQASEKNSVGALKLSLDSGFGLETDIRDHNGELVISHDMPKGDELTFRAFLQMYKETNSNLPLALNVKADGLQALVKTEMARLDLLNFFVFDMSIPDTLPYLREGIPVFGRQSEIEKEIYFYQDLAGVWIDSFFEDWLEESVLTGHLKAGKKVALVSPELHRRPYRDFWQKLSRFSCIGENAIMLCTDYPEEARLHFGNK